MVTASVLATGLAAIVESFLWGIVLMGMLLVFGLSIMQLVLLRRGERKYGVGLRGPAAKSDFPRFPSDDDYACRVPADENHVFQDAA